METMYGKLVLPGTNEIVGTGWLPPMPDLRDYTEDQKEIKAISKKLGISAGKMKKSTGFHLLNNNCLIHIMNKQDHVIPTNIHFIVY